MRSKYLQPQYLYILKIGGGKHLLNPVTNSIVLATANVIFSLPVLLGKKGKHLYLHFQMSGSRLFFYELTNGNNFGS